MKTNEKVYWSRSEGLKGPNLTTSPLRRHRKALRCASSLSLLKMQVRGSLLSIQVKSYVLPRLEAVLPVNSVGSEGRGTFFLFVNPLTRGETCFQLQHKPSLLPPPALLEEAMVTRSFGKCPSRRHSSGDSACTRLRNQGGGDCLQGFFPMQNLPFSDLKNGSQVSVLAERVRVS